MDSSSFSRAPRAHILDMPNEITSRILRAGLSGPQNPFDPQAYSNQINKVCKLLRDVALSERTLWTSISIDLDSIGQGLTPTFRDLRRDSPLARDEAFQKAADKMGRTLELWRKRSGEVSEIEACIRTTKTTEQPLVNICARFLLQVSSRLRVLAYVGASNVLQAFIGDGGVVSLNNLEGFLLDVSLTLCGRSNSLPITMPRLKWLTLYSSAANLYRHSAFPWAQLTMLSMRLDLTTFLQQLECLRLASQTLETLSLRSKFRSESYFDTTVSAQRDEHLISFPKVHTLFLSCSLDSGDELDLFTTPTLRTLSIDFSIYSRRYFAIPKLTDFLIRSKCVITSLYLDLSGPRWSMGDMQNLLAAVPATRVFGFQSNWQPEQSEMLIDLLHRGRAAGKKAPMPLLPALEEVAFLIKHHDPLQTNAPDALIDMLKARTMPFGQGARASGAPAVVKTITLEEGMQCRLHCLPTVFESWKKRGVRVSTASYYDFTGGCI